MYRYNPEPDMLIHLGHAIEKRGSDFVVLPYEARFGSLRSAKKWIKGHVKAEKLQMSMARTTRKNGLYDPGVLKAVFLAGGAGSGKSFAAENLFGFPDGFDYALSAGTGLKLLNTDPDFERNLKALQYKAAERGIPVSKFSPSNLYKLSPRELDVLGKGGTLTVGRPGGKKRRIHIEPSEAPRAQAKRWYKKRLKMWTRERLGILLDGTAKDYDKIARMKRHLESLGYDTMMLFLHTSLPVALKRNQKRSRRLSDTMVERTWRGAQAAKPRYGRLFGENFFEKDNTVYGPFAEEAVKSIARFERQPVQNPVGQRWVISELKRRGGGEIPMSAAKTARRLLGKDWEQIVFLREMEEGPEEENPRRWMQRNPGKPVGKAQKFIYAYLQQRPGGFTLSEITWRESGMHYGSLQSAAYALAKKGLIGFDGSRVTSGGGIKWARRTSQRNRR